MTKVFGAGDTFSGPFCRGAARAFFVMAYADFVESEIENDGDTGLPRAMNGEDWYDVAPEAPIYAYVLAGEMVARIEATNGKSVYRLAEMAQEADEARALARGKFVPEFSAEEFGRDLAMQYMGTGCSWFDDHADFPLEVPQHEVSHLTFDSEAYSASSEDS